MGALALASLLLSLSAYQRLAALPHAEAATPRSAGRPSMGSRTWVSTRLVHTQVCSMTSRTAVPEAAQLWPTASRPQRCLQGWLERHRRRLLLLRRECDCN